jgi:hypothetical protein
MSVEVAGLAVTPLIEKVAQQIHPIEFCREPEKLEHARAADVRLRIDQILMNARAAIAVCSR